MPDPQWHDACPTSELAPGDVTEVTLGSKRVAIYDCRDALHATSARCSHHGAPLVDGYLDGTTIECPLHQGCFDVTDGRPTEAPATRPLRSYPVRVTAGDVVQVLI